MGHPKRSLVADRLQTRCQGRLPHHRQVAGRTATALVEPTPRARPSRAVALKVLPASQRVPDAVVAAPGTQPGDAPAPRPRQVGTKPVCADRAPSRAPDRDPCASLDQHFDAVAESSPARGPAVRSRAVPGVCRRDGVSSALCMKTGDGVGDLGLSPSNRHWTDAPCGDHGGSATHAGTALCSEMPGPSPVTRVVLAAGEQQERPGMLNDTRVGDDNAVSRVRGRRGRAGEAVGRSRGRSLPGPRRTSLTSAWTDTTGKQRSGGPSEFPGR